jgi:predicted O-methyltransferase YrrM
MERAASQRQLRWRTDEDLVVGDVRFTFGPDRSSQVDPSDAVDWFDVHKPRWMVECYERLRNDNPVANVVELGIHHGGSTALFALLFDPAKLVAVDLMPTRVESLDRFIAAHTLQDHVRPYFGVDQADRGHLGSIIDAEFGSTPLDLIVDDASHLYRETCVSFNLLFPRLRPGGLYVIEDWSWQHAQEKRLHGFLDTPEGREGVARYLATRAGVAQDAPVSHLILEVVLTSAYAQDIVAEISSVRRGWTLIRRGSAELDPDTFDIAAAYGRLGRSVLNGDTAR